MQVRSGRWWVAAAGCLALGLGCGGAPGADAEPGTSGAEAAQLDTPRGGTTAWVRQLGGMGYEALVDIAAAPDGGVVVVNHIGRTGTFGAYPTSLGLVRLRANRTVAWSREIPVAQAQVHRPQVAVTGMGNVLLAVEVRCEGTGCPDLGGGRAPGGAHTLVAKYAPGGAFVWQRAIDALTCGPLAVDANGGVAFPAFREGTGPKAGARIVRLRWDGAPLWDLAAPVVVAGITPGPSALGFDPAGNLAVGDGLVFYSLDPAGRVRWTARLADPGVQGWIPDIGTTRLGTVVVIAQPTAMGTVSWAGTTYTAAQGGAPIAAFLAVAEAGGAPRFGRVLPPEYQAGDAAVDPAGRVVIASQGVGGWLIEKWNQAGARVWSRAFSGPVGWSGVAVDPASHHVRAAGSFSSTMDLGTGPMTARGLADGVVVDLNP